MLYHSSKLWEHDDMSSKFISIKQFQNMEITLNAGNWNNGHTEVGTRRGYFRTEAARAMSSFQTETNYAAECVNETVWNVK